MNRLWFEETDRFTGMTPAYMAHLIHMVAEGKEIDFYQARYEVVLHMEELALEAKRDNRSTWKMWDELGLLAHQAVEP